MKRLAICIGLLSGTILLGGCIDAVTIVLLTRKKSSHKSPVPDPFYHVWIASLADAAAASDQESQLRANGGFPDAAVWTDIGTGSASAVFTPAQAPGSYNAILVQVS